MARLSSGIFGPIHGKLGSVVGAVWKQTPYLRTMPRENKEGVKATPAQIASREKFKFVQDWLVPFYPYVTVGFRNHAKDKTEINAAFSKNYRLAIVGRYPDLSIDYAKVVLSRGRLPRLYAVQFELKAPDLLSLTWQQNRNDDSCYDDQVMLIVYNRELKLVDGFVGGRNRSDLKCDLNLNPKLIGKPLDVYVSVVSLNGKKVADSEYLGRIDPL
ncbi:DUF6266 family protein [Pedobacter nyackensis]|uniref:DUF6266 family protein n=1 Tax=Pedobacter nyackensis TaxID=475255 RepID=UPI00292D387D|nr:DUF6266 family protein [Pedobacter nyackensis]